MTEQVNLIPARLKSAVVGGHVAGADQIIDDSKGKNQQMINQEVDNALFDRYTKEETYNKTELNNMITTPDQEYVTLTAQSGDTLEDIFDGITGAANTVYRVGSWDGSQYDTTKYTEYAWNGTNFVPLDTKDSIELDEEPKIGSDNAVKSGGTYKNFKDINKLLFTQKDGEYIAITPIGTTNHYYVNYTTGETVYNWGDQIIKLKVKGYTKIKMKCLTVISGTVKGYAFFDENEQYISGGQRPFGEEADTIVTETYDIPENAAYIVQCWLVSQAGNFSAEVCELVNDKNIITETIKSVNKIEKYNVENSFNAEDENSIDIESTKKDNYYVDYTTGEEVYTLGEQVRRIDNLELYSKIVISCITSASSTRKGYALFDKHGNYLFGKQTEIDSIGGNLSSQTILIPKGASYILQSFKTSNTNFSSIAYPNIKEYGLALKKIGFDKMFQNILASFIWEDTSSYVKESSEPSLSSIFPNTRRMNPDNVVVNNGELLLKTTKVSSSPLQYDCAGIDIRPNTIYPTINNPKSLCFIANISMAKMRGLNQAFWGIGEVSNEVVQDFIKNHTTQTYDADATYKYEIDIEYNYPNKGMCSIFLWKTKNGVDSQVYHVSKTLITKNTDSHSYIIGWTENNLFWSVDDYDIMILPNYFVRTTPIIMFTQKVGNTFGNIDSSIEECETRVGSLIIKSAVAENVGTMKFINGVPYWWNGTAWVNSTGTPIN